MSDRVVSTTDSIAERSGAAVNSIATTPPPKKNPPPEYPQNTPRTETPTPPNHSKKGQRSPDGEPDWVNKDNRRFYLKLVDDSELLALARSSIDLHPKDNAALAESLVSAGLHKIDGAAFDSSSMSRIRGVVKNLSTATDGDNEPKKS